MSNNDLKPISKVFMFNKALPSKTDVESIKEDLLVVFCNFANKIKSCWKGEKKDRKWSWWKTGWFMCCAVSIEAGFKSTRWRSEKLVRRWLSDDAEVSWWIEKLVRFLQQSIKLIVKSNLVWNVFQRTVFRMELKLDFCISKALQDQLYEGFSGMMRKWKDGKHTLNMMLNLSFWIENEMQTFRIISKLNFKMSSSETRKFFILMSLFACLQCFQKISFMKSNFKLTSFPI